MPYIRIETNVEWHEATGHELVARASQLAATLTQKPERVVQAQINAGQALSHGGSFEPAAYVEFKSIGLQAADCPGFAKAICEFILTEFGVPTDRIYIEFKDIQREFFGWDNKTFAG